MVVNVGVQIEVDTLGMIVWWLDLVSKLSVNIVDLNLPSAINNCWLEARNSSLQQKIRERLLHHSFELWVRSEFWHFSKLVLILILFSWYGWFWSWNGSLASWSKFYHRFKLLGWVWSNKIFSCIPSTNGVGRIFCERLLLSFAILFLSPFSFLLAYLCF